MQGAFLSQRHKHNYCHSTVPEMSVGWVAKQQATQPARGYALNILQIPFRIDSLPLSRASKEMQMSIKMEPELREQFKAVAASRHRPDRPRPGASLHRRQQNTQRIDRRNAS